MSNKTKIGVIGSGDVAKSLAAGFMKNGHPVMMGSRNPANLDDWKSENNGAETGTFASVAKFGEIVVLAVKGTASATALGLAGAENLEGKCVIDATNPITDSPPTNGVFPYFSSISESLMESLQKDFPARASSRRSTRSVADTWSIRNSREVHRRCSIAVTTTRRKNPSA